MADNEKPGPSELTDGDLDEVRGGTGAQAMLAAAVNMTPNSTSQTLPSNLATSDLSIADMLQMQSQLQTASTQTQVFSEVVSSIAGPGGVSSPLKGG